MLYAILPIFAILGMLYFYSRNSWNGCYYTAVITCGIGVVLSVVMSQMGVDVEYVRIAYALGDIYLVISPSTLYVMMLIYGIVLCGSVVLRHDLFAQGHAFEKVILLWGIVFFAIIAAQAQSVYQIVFGVVGMLGLAILMRAYRDENIDTDGIWFGIFLKTIIVLSMLVGLITHGFETFVVVEWQPIIWILIALLCGVFPFGLWLFGFFVQSKVYAMIVSAMFMVLSTRLIYVLDMHDLFDFHNVYGAMYGGFGMIFGACMAYNQTDICKRLASLYGAFGGVGMVGLAIFPTPQAILLIQYYALIFVVLGTVVYAVQYVLSGERDLKHMGGGRIYAPLVYILYFAVVLGVGYMPIHPVSMVLGDAVHRVYMDFTMYDWVSIGLLFFMGHFMICYGVGRMGAMMFLQNAQTHDMVSAYIRPASKYTIFAIVFAIALHGLSALLTPSGFEFLGQKTWTYGGVLYGLILVTSVFAFGAGILKSSPQMDLDTMYANGMYVHQKTDKVIARIVYAIRHKRHFRFAVHTYILSDVITNVMQVFKIYFSRASRWEKGFGFYSVMITTGVFVLIVLWDNV